MVLASASASEPSTTSVRPRSTTPVRPRSTTPVRPRSTTPVRPRSTTPVRPRSTTPVRPRSTTPMRPHRALLTIIDEDQSATSSKYSDEDSLNGPDTGYTTASSVQYASEDETTVVARSHYGPNDTLGQELPTQFAPGRSFMRPGNDNTSGAGASYAGSDFSRDATPQSDPDDELSEELPTQFAPGSLFMEPGNDNMSEAASFAGSDFFRDPRFVHSEPESGDEADELGGGVLAQLSPGRSFMRPDNDNISEAASYAGSDFSRDAMSQSDPDDTLIQELPTQFEPGSLFVEPDNDNMTEAESSYAGSDVFQDARLVFSNPDSDDEGGVKLQL
ncbi:hypothetical protein EDC01DRAFT_775171 [Geopyxis carbonaria]|nr:hypothetical protein EDC01DRAFT_775171 [Geopyxis carbonaria]